MSTQTFGVRVTLSPLSKAGATINLEVPADQTNNQLVQHISDALNKLLGERWFSARVLNRGWQHLTIYRGGAQ